MQRVFVSTLTEMRAATLSANLWNNFSETAKDWEFGGAKRDRTADLLHAMQALSQLSYSPTSRLRTKFAVCKIWWS